MSQEILLHTSASCNTKKIIMDHKLYDKFLIIVHHLSALALFCQCIAQFTFNPLPHMPILGSSNSAENKSMKFKIWTNGVQSSD